MIIVNDTSIITNFAAIGHIQILHQLYDRILIPEAVYQELTHIDPPVPGTLIVGLLGVLLEAKQRSLISEVKPLMDALINTFKFRISQVLYNQIIGWVMNIYYERLKPELYVMLSPSLSLRINHVVSDSEGLRITFLTRF